MTTTVEVGAPVEADIPFPPLTTLLVIWAPAAHHGRLEPGARRPTAVPVEEEPTWEDAEWR